MNPAAHIAYDDARRPVPATDPEVYAEPDSVRNDSAVAAIEALKSGLLVILANGRRGALVRVGALAHLCGLFTTPTEAAASVQVNRSTMCRAVASLRSEITSAAKRNRAKATSRNGDKPSSAPH